MTIPLTKLCWLIACALFCLQSLADVAREEAERRRLLEQQGIEEKVIDPYAAQDGNITVSTSSPSTAPKSTSEKSIGSGRTSLHSFRTALQKLDRAIRQDDERLELLRGRVESERWEIQKARRSSSRSRASKSGRDPQEEIDELQIKLRQLRQERSETYEAGKKAGFLPGELDGKGIIP